MAEDVIPHGAERTVVLHGLVRRRAEYAGEAERRQAELRDLMGAIDHIDAVIRLFNPDVRIDAIRPKRPRAAHAALHGEVTKAVIEALRETDAPLTSHSLAACVIRERGINEPDRELELLMAKRVRACLRLHRLSGRVRAVPLEGAPQGWVLVNSRADRMLTELTAESYGPNL